MENIRANVSAVLMSEKKEEVEKEYNARGKRIYTNAINRENARKKMEKNKKTYIKIKNKIK